MQLSSLGFMHPDYSMSIPSEILRPIGLGQGKAIYCMSYPKKYSQIACDDLSNFNDNGFVLTGIPYEDWPLTARFTIKVLDKPGSVGVICKAVKDFGGAISFVRGGSTGYTYFTLNLTVKVNDVEITHCDFNEKCGYFNKVYSRFCDLERFITKECKHVLYEGKGFVKLDQERKFNKSNYQHHQSIVINVCTSLTLFWRIKEIYDESLEVFGLSLITNNKVQIEDLALKNLIQSGDKAKLDTSDFVHRALYLSVDTKDQTIRLRVLSNDNESTILGVRLDWEAEDPNGIVNEITSFFETESYHIRHVHGKETKKTKSSFGRVNLLVDLIDSENSKKFKESYGVLSKDSKEKSDESIWSTSFDRSRLRKEINDFIGKKSKGMQTILDVRLTSPSLIVQKAWKKSDLNNRNQSIRFLISSPSSRYNDAKKLSGELSSIGYEVSTIEEELESVTGVPFYNMLEKIKKASVVLVLVDEDYGQVLFNNKDRTFYKNGFYSEIEATMAASLGVKVIPITYNERSPDIGNFPQQSIFGKKKDGVVHLNFKKKKEKTKKILHDIYMEVSTDWD